MELDKIYEEFESIKTDKEKVLFCAKIINYVETLYTNIGFNPSEVNYINNINQCLKQEIDKTLNSLIKTFTKEIEFILYYNNETRNNNRNSGNRRFR